MLEKKGYLELPFAWLFAIVAGAFILFLAIFFATKLINLEQTSIDAQTGKEIGILLNPLETSFEAGKTTSFIMPVDTRIYNKCNNKGIFGRQIIQISQKSFNKWTETDLEVGFSNKYIFSENYTEGKKFYLFSKPFEFPFKISDLIYMTSSNKIYCFKDPPLNIEEELASLNQGNIRINNCSGESIKICFSGGSECEVDVNYEYKWVIRNSEKVYFEKDALMYAAIFSDKKTYECQLKRLMQRVNQLALLYQDKADFVSKAGCESNLKQDLLMLSNSASDFEDSSNLGVLAINVESIKDKNNFADCELW
ncbi:MAG: hypothetical protein KKF68_00120 [Nanoarchaeota archaeon]|nr:hypothetical protein [Nanoarchaeota archaeon]